MHISLCMLSHFSHVWLFVTLGTVAYQAPLSMGFSRQEYWSGLSCPAPGDLSTQGSSSHLLRLLYCRLYHWANGEAHISLFYRIVDFYCWTIWELVVNSKYLCMCFLRTEDFLLHKLSYLRNVMSIQYCLIRSPYSNFSSCSGNMFYNLFSLIQDPIENYTLHLVVMTF